MDTWSRSKNRRTWKWRRRHVALGHAQRASVHCGGRSKKAYAGGVSTLRDLVEEYTSLGRIEIEHLHRLAGDWQLIADLSFADLLLWVAIDPARPGGEPV